MKRSQDSFLGGLASIALMALTVASAQAQNAVVSDSNVEEAIRDAISKASGDLTLDDLEKVTFLDLKAKGMTQVTIPEGLTKCEGMDLSDNALAGSLFAPLKFPDDMLSLTDLDVSRNKLASLSFLTKFPNLRFLDLASNSFGTLTFPEGLENLEELDLSRNALTTLTIPAGLANLQRLDLSRNKLAASVFAPLKLPNDMSSLTVLDMSFNELGGFKVPTGLTSLVQLILFNNKLTNLELPEDIGALEKLDVYGNNLKNITLPLGAKSLQVIDLGDNPDLKTVTVPEGISENVIDVVLQYEVELITERPPLPEIAAVTLSDAGDFEGNFEGSDRYILYRSEDLQAWSEVTTITGDGATTFKDSSALKNIGTAYYRLGYGERLPVEE